ncbi:glycoside hydrolase family 13 protein [Nocardioides sp.]|uniref:glycoside hydrolase family 13 protein n=1 Tax=Nocardioides sp. TaxID=35761 RepID=UPI003D0BEBBE
MSNFNDPKWWRQAVVYQIYIRSFADGDGQGLGDMAGITARLPHLAELGVDAIWLTPFYTSPQHDHGYDVADYLDVDPRFGTLDDFDTMLGAAHDLGIRVIVDIVPNHSSDEHVWFQAALEAAPGSAERARYLFRDGRGTDGELPPNNWQSIFGGPAWTRVPDGQWYLHLFDRTQPDFDWRNPEVGDMFEDVLRFWLDRGVDGFRIDVAHGLFKEATLRDQVITEVPEHSADSAMVERQQADEPMWDQPEVHDVYRRWHKILESYPGDRMAVAEAWTSTAASMARFIRPDELQQTFNFNWLLAPWSAESFAEVITDTLSHVAIVGATPTWVLSNHDVVRHATRYGGGPVGVARARAATMAMLALPGSAYLYQGEELGLEQVEVPQEFWQDPSALTTGVEGRDGCRVPIPWSGQVPPFGFGPGSGQPWLPQPPHWDELTVEAQAADPSSTLSFYRRALAVRREAALRAGDEVTIISSDDDVLVFSRGDLVCHVNCGSTPVTVPAGEVLLCSGDIPGAPDTATWLR